MSGLEIKNTENFLDVKIKKFLKSANKKKKKDKKKHPGKLNMIFV